VAGFDPLKPHMRRDYSKVFAFAEKWRVYHGKDTSERKPIEDRRNRVINYINFEDEADSRQ